MFLINPSMESGCDGYGGNRRSVREEMAEMEEEMNRIARALNESWWRRRRRRARVSDSLINEDQLCLS